jgi:hypothetical protein
VAALTTGCGGGDGLSDIGGGDEGTDSGLTGPGFDADSDGADETGGLDGGDPTGPQPPSSDDDGGDSGGGETACGDTQVQVGSACIPCQPTSGPADTDILLASLTLRARIGGEEPSASPLEDGVFVLRDSERGDEVVIGNTSADDLSVSVLPGTYDLYWQHDSGNTLVPLNSNARLGGLTIERTGDIVLPADSPFVDALGMLLVDVPMVEVHGSFEFNGAGAPDSALESGQVFLIEPGSGDEIELGSTRDGTYDVRIVPGTYEIHYRHNASGSTAPRNNDALVAWADVPAGDSFALDIDIPVVTISGDFSFNGQDAPDSVLERGRISLRDLLTGDEFDLGVTSDGQYSAPVIPGSYDLVYRFAQGSVSVPRNLEAVLEMFEITDAGPSLTKHINVPFVPVSGSVLIGGAPPPTDPGNVGVITLRGVSSDDEVVLGDTDAGSFSALVIPGEYEAFYSQKTSSGLVPINTNARLQAVAVLDEPTTVNIDVPFSPVAGTVTLNGTLPPDSEYDDGRIYLRNPATDDSVLLGSTRIAQVGGLVVPGEYEMYYEVETPGSVVPQNAEAFLGAVQIVAGVGLDLPVEIEAFALAGAVTVSGGAPPNTDNERGNLLLQDATTMDLIFLGEVGAGAFSVPLTAGKYVLYYENLETLGGLPANTHAALGCFQLGK